MLFSFLFYGSSAFLCAGLPGTLTTGLSRCRLRAISQQSVMGAQGNQPEAGTRKVKHKPRIKPNDNRVGEPATSSIKKAWESGNTFVDLSNRKQGNKKGSWLRNEPWWMREDESRNPRLLSKYQPWWFKKYKSVDASLTLAELKAEATLRGISTVGKKPELLERLQEEERRYSLSDNNFVAPTFATSSVSDVGACYPEVYEKNAQILTPDL